MARRASILLALILFSGCTKINRVLPPGEPPSEGGDTPISSGATTFPPAKVNIDSAAGTQRISTDNLKPGG